jgi:hypothetical protein
MHHPVADNLSRAARRRVSMRRLVWRIMALGVAAGMLTATGGQWELPVQGAMPHAALLAGERRETENRVASIIHASIGGVVGARADQSPYVDLILWTDDSAAPGEIDTGELMVLTHHRLLRTLTLYIHESPEQREPAPPDALAAPGFADRFRASPAVRGIRLADGVSDLPVEIIEPEDGGRGEIVIQLIWPAEEVDGVSGGPVKFRVASIPSAPLETTP